MLRAADDDQFHLLSDECASRQPHAALGFSSRLVTRYGSCKYVRSLSSFQTVAVTGPFGGMIGDNVVFLPFVFTVSFPTW